MALYGLEIAETLLPEEGPPDYERVEIGYHKQLKEEEQVKWIKYVDRHRERLPQSWVNSVIESAKEDGIKPPI